MPHVAQTENPTCVSAGLIGAGGHGDDSAATEDPAVTAVAVLRQHGIRPTRQRVAVYSALRATLSHPTAESLHRQLDTPSQPIALATIYNVLEALAAAGLCRSIPAAEGNRWDATMDDHVHLRRRNSSSVLDVPDDLGQRILGSIPAEILAEVEQRMGVRIGAVSVELHEG